MATENAAEAAAHSDHEHPTPRMYVQIAIALALLTALEISTFYVEFGVLFLPTLIGLMVIKFALVVGFFMHLKFDLGLYTRMVRLGVTMAVLLYGAMLLEFSGGPTALQ